MSLVALSAIAAPAHAQIPTPEPDPTGIEVGAHVGYARALGDRVAGQPFEDTIDGAWPLAVDVGYRLTPHLYLGGLLSYARLDLDKEHIGCNREVVDGPGDCSGSALRIAAEAQWRWSRRWLATWIAAGFGAERVQIDFTSGCMRPGPFSTTDTGFEFGHVEIGVGARPDPRVVVGPFASYSVGMFRTSATKGSCNSPFDDIPNKAIHGIASGGLRVTYTVR